MNEMATIEIVKGSKSKANKAKAKAKKAGGLGFVATVGSGIGGGKRYSIGHPKIAEGKPISTCRFLRLLGFYGFTANMAYAMLEDAGIPNYNPHTMGCQLGSGRQHGSGAKECHHGTAGRDDAEAFGKLIAEAKEHYLAKLGDDAGKVKDAGAKKLLAPAK